MARPKKNVDVESVDDDKFMQEMLKAVDNEYGGLVEDGVLAGDITEYLSTGSYTLNALLSGSVYGGLPGNKILALAGEPSTGKTFFAINILKSFLDDHPQGRVIYFETESAVTKGMFVQRGVDAKRVVVLPVQTVQEFRTQCLKIVNMALEKKPAERPKLMFVLDSLGNLSTEKEMQDTAEGKDTRDMTRAQLIRGAFRTLTLKLGKAGFPLICTNHVFQTIGQYVSTKEMGGGQGLQYLASQVLFLSKSKEKDKSGAVVGAIIKCNLRKSRTSIENRRVEVLLDYKTGLDKYYGLLDLAEKFGIFKKVSTKYELPDGTSVFGTEIERNPEKYFTKEILDAIDARCPDEFLYGKTSAMEEKE